MIEMDGITMRFGGVTALDAVSARMEADVTGLVGPNGAGKTTLMNVISGFLTPRAGRIELDGTELTGRSPVRRAALGLRRTYQQELIVGELSLRENVRAVWDHLGAGTPATRIDAALDLAGLSALADVPGHALDLFQRRMAEIAKAVIGTPRLILMDEPAAGLDDAESRRLRDLIAALPAETGAKVVIIDHDTDLISELCEETMVLNFGSRLAFGPTREVLDDPAVREAYMGTAA